MHYRIEISAVVPFDIANNEIYGSINVPCEWLLMSSYDPKQSDLRRAREDILKVLVLVRDSRHY